MVRRVGTLQQLLRCGWSCVQWFCDFDALEMKNLFAYGTLMCNSIMQEVSGCCPVHVPGTLRGYSRWSVRGEHYPAIAPNEEGRVEGLVYRNMPGSAWVRLDRFEGDMYVRRQVNIELHEGINVMAATYVVQPEFLHLLEQSDWNLSDFIANGKAGFQKHYKGYLSL